MMKNVFFDKIEMRYKSVLKLCVFLSVFCIGACLHAQYFIRYNHLGYEPESPKKIIVLSEVDLSQEKWILSTAKGVIKTQQINPSISNTGIHTPFKFNYLIDISKTKAIDDYTLTLKDSSIHFRIDTNLYSFIPSEILRYFRVQRSGTEACLDHKIAHKGDKKCLVFRRQNNQNNQWAATDELPKYVNMSGGWYDAGDYLKFTLTTAYSTYLMLLAYEQNPALFQYKKYSGTEFNDLLDESSWGLDYLLKTYADSTEFILQVGGSKDHQQGNRLPEFDALNKQREAYSGFSATQMAYTAAALALGAKLFKTIDSSKAKVYKQQAIAIYNKARTLTTCFWVKQGWEEFYADKTPYDNLLLAATELYALTKSSTYKEDMYIFKDAAKQSYWSSWGNCNLLAHSRAGISFYDKKELENFDVISKETGNIWGLAHKYTWGSLYSFYSEANGVLYREVNKKDSSFSAHYWSTLDYSLGTNNWGKSFVCSKNIKDCACNTYSQIYILQPHLTPIGAVSEGPGDRSTHEQLKKYFKIPENYPLEKFNSTGAVFYDLNTNFQTMETTIVGLAEALLFYSLLDKRLRTLKSN